MTTDTTTVLAGWSIDALRIFQNMREAHQKLLRLEQYEQANDVTYLLTYAGADDLTGTNLTLDELADIFEALVQYSTFLGTHNGNTNKTPIEVIYKKY